MGMESESSTASQILAYAESFPEVRAGVARLEDVLGAPSYQVVPEEEWITALSSFHQGKVSEWPPEGRSVLVLGLHHPREDPRLDWWIQGNTPGNRRLMEISESLRQWVREQYGLGAQPLPYYVEWGGLFLKDAAVLAGLGVIGHNNLLLHPEWGPRIRLRAVLLEGDLEPTGPMEGFFPCNFCSEPCRKACPRDAFHSGAYDQPSCIAQMEADMADKAPLGETDEGGNALPAIRYCRACELACPFPAPLDTL
jgi:epoxyqueuosine reductase